MNDDTLDRLVGRTSMIDDRLPGLDLADAQAALLEEIVATPVAVGRRHRRSWALVAAVAAVALAIGVPAWLTRGGRDAADVQVTARSLASADPNLQVLLDLPGWRVDNVATSDEGGSIRFVSGRRDLEVTAYPAASYGGYYSDRLGVSTPQPVTVLGQNGELFTYSPTDHAVMLPARGGTFLELRGQGSDLPSYLDLLGNLQRVPAKRWLAAMPASVVTPDKELRVAREMLDGVPTPPGFDVTKIPSGDTKDYYQFGATVTGRVFCGWIDAYREARQQGDQAGITSAVDALGTSRTWKVLKRMNAEGDWPEAIWEASDEIKAGDLRPQSDYRDGFSCHR
ncbi:MAG: hypothetical protein JWO46_2741 [Nocardioidaceae bacterium]|nr:hypothetical protein [Nocardioidaceae bacterium]